MTTFVYALLDPRTSAIRYVGKSYNPRHRLRAHIWGARWNRQPTHRCNWIKSLLKAGLEPDLLILDRCDGDGSECERRFIAYFRAAGVCLTNLTDGGENFHHHPESIEKTRLKKIGQRLSSEAKRKIGDFFRCRILTAQHKAKIGAAHTGMRASAETRVRIAASKKGFRPTLEQIERSRLARIGMKQSPEWVAKRMAGKCRRSDWTPPPIVIGAPFKKKLPNNNSSGFRGASYHPAHRSWRAFISVEGKQKSLGSYPTALQAALAHDAAAAELYGCKAVLNFAPIIVIPTSPTSIPTPVVPISANAAPFNRKDSVPPCRRPKPVMPVPAD